MYMLNKSAAFVKLKKPYLDWANYISEKQKYTLETINRENHVFLLPEFDTEEELQDIIKDLYVDIFAIELGSWTNDENSWPKKRDYQTFQKWFDIEIHSMIFDPYEDEIERDEFLV